MEKTVIRPLIFQNLFLVTKMVQATITLHYIWRFILFKEKLPIDKVRQALGAFSVLSVLELVDCGVDIFDSSLAYLSTKEGKAFCFPQTTDGSSVAFKNATFVNSIK